MKTLRIADNNGVSEYDTINKAEAVKLRSQLIQSYGYTKRYGFNRVNDGDTIYFNHAIYSTVKFEIV